MTNQMRLLLLSIFFLGINHSLFSQCQVSSSNGYTVNMVVTPVAVISSRNPCPYGYNYNLEINYDIYYTGTNTPSNLFTLQGSLSCDGDGHFFDLPNSGGSGTTNSRSNPYRTASDCATATPSSLGCNSVTMEVQGPGLPTTFVPCATSNSLPIELKIFEVEVIEQNIVQISWTTISEVNNDYFTIEKSVDGKNWDVIAKIEGAGNSTKELNYLFIDREGIQTVSYYRLKQTDFDGKYEYFRPSFANLNKEQQNSNELNIYPNPFISDFTIEGSGEQLQLIKLYNAQGQELNIKRDSYTRSGNQIHVDMDAYETGNYFIRSGNKIYKLLKK